MKSFLPTPELEKQFVRTVIDKLPAFLRCAPPTVSNTKIVTLIYMQMDTEANGYVNV